MTETDSPTESARPRGGLRAVGSWTASNLVAAITLMGLVWYAIAVLSYATFYGKLGLEPSEVGLGYAETISRAASALPVLIFIWLVFIAFFLAVVLAEQLVRALWRRFRGSASEGSRRDRQEILGGVSVYSLAVALFLLFFVLPEASRERAEDVRAGHAVEPGVLARENPLRLRAQPARISWLSAGGLDDDEEQLAERPLLYLGESGGMLVLYDSQGERAVRLPSDAVILTLTGEQLPQEKEPRG